VLQALLESPPPDPDAGLRQDLTHLTVFTIDDASTQEVDDALSLSRDEHGNVLLWVHIADPTRWVMPGGLADAWRGKA
jgi:exoribonuclease-2